jgi:hypothetical protein
MHEKELHIVKHVGTGKTLPVARGRSGRGGSHWDPTEPDDISEVFPPRIFMSRRAAQNFIQQWARGVFTRYASSDDEDVFEEVSVKDVGRTTAMLVAVPVRITELMNDNI